MGFDRAKEYNHREIEPKWEKKWEEENIYRAVDFDKKPKKYVLFEFPYPSGERLHIGHAFSFTGTDVLSRFYRMKGFNVLCPMGWDAFGLPAENYAVKTGINPAITTAENIINSKVQAKRWGLSVDWDREVSTTDPQYYRWTQWIFLQWYKKGLAEKEEMPINWCPSCKTGLANEEVVGGNCERCGAEVSRRTIKQWVVKITKYADRLIEGLESTDFIEKVKASQINWIGRSEGAEIEFRIKNSEFIIKVFTTRPDTIYGATFMVLSPEHELVKNIKDEKVQNYVENAGKKSDLERTELNKEKTGVFSGLYAINPATEKEIPIWISDFVLSSYGTGAIMAVPAHDERDFAFAKKYELPIVPVVEPPFAKASEGKWDFDEKPYTEIDKITEEAIKNAIGKKSVSYHLRDWIFSRQHYWGEPIPIIYCDKCGEMPVSEEDLPVELPMVDKYKPTDSGESPLAGIPDWVNTKCPKCGGPAKRETDTMPNWAGSDWYFLRYLDPQNDQVLVDLKKAKYWLPVDIYVGGDEHNTLHLLYSRFTYLFLRDIGAVPQEILEPYHKRLSHGVILGKDNQRMSKSRGNVINPDEVVEAFGADSLRMYLMFMGPFDYTLTWNQESLEGCSRFLKRVWNLFNQLNQAETDDQDLLRKLNQTIKKVGEDIQGTKFNTAIAALMELLNLISGKKLSKTFLDQLLLLLAPFAPHLTEELWQRQGNTFSVHKQPWPNFNPALIKEETVVIAIQVNGKLRGTTEIQTVKIKDQKEIEKTVKENEKIQKYLEGQEVKRIVFVPGKLINFVI